MLFIESEAKSVKSIKQRYLVIKYYKKRRGICCQLKARYIRG